MSVPVWFLGTVPVASSLFPKGELITPSIGFMYVVVSFASFISCSSCVNTVPSSWELFMFSTLVLFWVSSLFSITSSAFSPSSAPPMPFWLGIRYDFIFS